MDVSFGLRVSSNAYIGGKIPENVFVGYKVYFCGNKICEMEFISMDNCYVLQINSQVFFSMYFSTLKLMSITLDSI